MLVLANDAGENPEEEPAGAGEAEPHDVEARQGHRDDRKDREDCPPRQQLEAVGQGNDEGEEMDRLPSRLAAERERSHAVNVDGTKNVLREARSAGVSRLAYTSTNTVTFAGEMIDADETWPYAEARRDLYPSTKVKGEQAGLAATGQDGPPRWVAVGRPSIARATFSSGFSFEGGSMVTVVR